MKVQCVLYQNPLSMLERLIAALAICAWPAGEQVVLDLGDCSPQPLLDPSTIERWRHQLLPAGAIELRYTYFGANLGFGGGHNRLWLDAPLGERVLIINPDAVPAIHLPVRLHRLAERHPRVGAVEARQIPIEHPKPFNPTTLECDWVSGACTLLDARAFTAVGGFDEVFFLYCEDVDLSWRLRAGGYRLLYCPDTFVYHAKRLVDGQVLQSEAERYHGALGTMLLRVKYGRADLNTPLLELLRADPSPLNETMLADYGRLKVCMTLATPREQEIPCFGPRDDFFEPRWTYPLSARRPESR